MCLTPALGVDAGMTFESERALPERPVEIVYAVSCEAGELPGRGAGWVPASQRQATAHIHPIRIRRPIIPDSPAHKPGLSGFLFRNVR